MEITLSQVFVYLSRFWRPQGKKDYILCLIFVDEANALEVKALNISILQTKVILQNI